MSIQTIVIAVVALIMAGLGVTVEIEHERISALTAKLQAANERVDVCVAQNKGFADEIKNLTADAARYRTAAAAATASLATFKHDADQRLRDQQKEIDSAAQPSDDVESPALRSALRLVRGTAPGH